MVGFQKFAFLTPLKAILVNPLSGGEHILLYWVKGNRSVDELIVNELIT